MIYHPLIIHYSQILKLHLMARIHLFEFEDFSWFPKGLRNYMTDFLQFVSNRFDVYKKVVPMIGEVMKESDTNQIIDLASGGGGGLLTLSEHLRKNNPELKIILTDFYPNIDAFKTTAARSDVFTYYEKSVDARNVPVELKGLRTQFLSLHHFRPEDAVRILQNALDSGNPIALFETQERNLPSILAMIFSPVSVILTTPFIRPFKIGRIVFTYLIPLVPLFIFVGRDRFCAAHVLRERNAGTGFKSEKPRELRMADR